MKQIKHDSGFTITELVLAMAFSAILVLVMGVVMVDSQRGWMDSYSKVHGGAASDAMVTKTAFDRVIRKASRSMYHLDALDDLSVYYYDHWLTSIELDRYARFYRPADAPSQLYIQHGNVTAGVKQEVQTELLLAAHVTDLEFKPVSGGVEMKLVLDDGRESTTLVSTALLHNE